MEVVLLTLNASTEFQFPKSVSTPLTRRVYHAWFILEVIYIFSCYFYHSRFLFAARHEISVISGTTLVNGFSELATFGATISI